MEQEIVIGCEAMDITTTLRGIITARVVKMNGNLRYVLQPPAAPGADKIPDSYEIDVQSLEYVGPGVSARAVACPVETGIELGGEYIDIVSGLKGIATERYDSLNGCVYYVVRGKTKAAVKEQPLVYVDYAQLKPTSAKVKSVINHLKKSISKAQDLSAKATAAELPKAARTPSKKAPGGPTTLAPRF